MLYQVGVLEALDDICDGFGSLDFDLYLGTGSGAALAALLANRVPPREVALALEGKSEVLPPFDLDRLMTPNYSELWRKSYSLPRSVYNAVKDNVALPTEVSFQDLMVSLTGTLPSGFYVADYVGEYMREALNQRGRTDEFDELGPDLYIMATDIDSGRSVTFSRGSDPEIPISRAVTATSAIPMLFAPVEIEGRNYVDGTTTKMLHLSLALGLDSTFNLAVTPIRPIHREENGQGYVGGRGVVSIARQALRMLLHNRLQAGLRQYRDRPEHVDIALVQPAEREGGALFFNVRKPRTRMRLHEAGYRRGREEIERQADLFERHGLPIVRSRTTDPSGNGHGPRKRARGTRASTRKSARRPARVEN